MALTWAESYLGRVRASIGDSDTIFFVGARTVVLDEQGRLLLIQRSDNHRWAIPAGAMELGESMAECAVRELWEETGLRATSLTPYAFYTAYTYTNEYRHTYQQVLMSFVVHSWEGELLRQTEESVDAGFFPLDALPGQKSFVIDEALADLATFQKTGILVMK
ncbi:8-oxo-dGTP pyrophosphatase MutT (NUDIX family) [Actinoplanes campanulatus]|uniref:8-oxo-dGTP pyrophosphatase MutT (NUDIX family) n=1 Tax=Actinoplanes campanulatus TaxID=113559 RepID=A0A7W5FI27_9ACTN|nr:MULTISPECIES: NUDIX domain-containing protein [Actinoplanes]MBB3099278.1 8-oxo-dGTP pyrophosphatase MutT (NUDIX family) [Actinoplanes campanulatus]GGN40650.1 NUDIX domain-containing protein [Actinoplanes campanulatus]GID40596.1 NUDIX domain-containing protein [Actinoplanes campanulatus]GID47397.1 NUDIX domain-containing protein [Actinoplanes capillaceus]